MAARAIILFDGICNLCSSAVQFVIKRDPQNYFRFASLQSEAGQQLLKEHGLSGEGFDSFVLMENGKMYTGSSAALRVVKRLSGCWPLLYGLIIVPSLVRDAMYNLVARNRYRWFGKKEACWLPDPSLSRRFLG